jgi:hypothetical protein
MLKSLITKIFTFWELSDGDIVRKIASSVCDDFGTSSDGFFDCFLRFNKSDDIIENLSSEIKLCGFDFGKRGVSIKAKDRRDGKVRL